MLGLKLNHDSKRGHWTRLCCYTFCNIHLISYYDITLHWTHISCVSLVQNISWNLKLHTCSPVIHMLFQFVFIDMKYFLKFEIAYCFAGYKHAFSVVTLRLIQLLLVCQICCHLVCQSFCWIIYSSVACLCRMCLEVKLWWVCLCLCHGLTHWGLMTPCGDRDWGEHWLR